MQKKDPIAKGRKNWEDTNEAQEFYIQIHKLENAAPKVADDFAVRTGGHSPDATSPPPC